MTPLDLALQRMGDTGPRVAASEACRAATFALDAVAAKLPDHAAREAWWRAVEAFATMTTVFPHGLAVRCPAEHPQHAGATCQKAVGHVGGGDLSHEDAEHRWWRSYAPGVHEVGNARRPRTSPPSEPPAKAKVALPTGELVLRGYVEDRIIEARVHTVAFAWDLDHASAVLKQTIDKAARETVSALERNN